VTGFFSYEVKAMAFRIDEIFNDPTPDGIINQRLVFTMTRIGELTDLGSDEKQEFLNLLLLIGKKLISVWRQLQEYKREEDRLIRVAKDSQPLEKQEVQRVSYSLDLFLAHDLFLVQTKSTLDYLVKVPIPILGRNVWPLRTFTGKGEGVLNALDRNVPKRYADKVRLIKEMVIKKHLAWLEATITARDRINHFLDGGVDFRAFLVIKVIKDEKERIHVPQFPDGMTAREMMEVTFLNLLMLVEDFIAGFLLFRLPPKYSMFHVPSDPRKSVKSPWIVIAAEEEEKFMKQFGKWEKF
jgi:hypothetical protein